MDGFGLSHQNSATSGLYVVFDTVSSSRSWSTTISAGNAALVCIVDDGSSTQSSGEYITLLLPNGPSKTVYLGDYQFISDLDPVGNLTVRISEISGRNPSPLYSTTIGVVPLELA